MELMRNEAGWPIGKGVSCCPQLQFGQPCIFGTRITVEILYGMHRGGNSAMEIAGWYGLDEADVICAIVWWQEYMEKGIREKLGKAIAWALRVGGR